MPVAAIGLGLGTAIAGAGAAGATAYGAHKASSASDKAGRIQGESDARAFALEQQRDEEERRRWNAEHDFMRRQWDAQEARLAPYRAAGAQAIGRLSGLVSPEGQRQWRSPSNAGRAGLKGLI